MKRTREETVALAMKRYWSPPTPKEIAARKKKFARIEKVVEKIHAEALYAYRTHGLRDMIKAVDDLLASYRSKFIIPLPVALDTLLDAVGITAARAMPIPERRVVSDHTQLLISMYERAMREAGIPEGDIPTRPLFHPRHAMVEPLSVVDPEQKPKRRSRPRKATGGKTT